MEKYFAHEKIREGQKELMEDVRETIFQNKILLAHAPTGIGKTAGVLAPMLYKALKDDLIIFFLTSRNTQHKIVVETIQKLNKKLEEKIKTTSFVGRQKMCLMPPSNKLSSHDFSEYCKTLRETGQCSYYNNVWRIKKRTGENPRKELTGNAKIFLHKLQSHTYDELIKISKEELVCPYEIALQACKNSKVIIGDYYHIFSPGIRKAILHKIDKELSDILLIVDEAHNLPGRIRELLTSKLTNFMISRGLREAEKYELVEVIEGVKAVEKSFSFLKKKLVERGLKESKVSTEGFVELLEKNLKKVGLDYKEFISLLDNGSEEVREEQEISYLASIKDFLVEWQEKKKGFVRLFRIEEGERERLTLIKIAIDPSLVSKEVFNEVNSAVLMSGTLLPLRMYTDLFGIKNAVIKSYSNPFPSSNRLNLIVPETTTKYNKRNKKMFERIAIFCAKCVNACPGNSIVYFPSYDLRNKVYEFFKNKVDKPILLEQSGISVEEKKALILEFKNHSREGKLNASGAVLLACISGSFGEGIDLPGKHIEQVIIVGVPLETPDLETREKIKYYEEKYGKGWDYGYIYPAMNKVLQAAGRTIRSEKDKGVIVFLDERYAWSKYNSIMPEDWFLKKTNEPWKEIKEFFKHN